jgi:hypothetical protein
LVRAWTKNDWQAALDVLVATRRQAKAAGDGPFHTQHPAAVTSQGNAKRKRFRASEGEADGRLPVRLSVRPSGVSADRGGLSTLVTMAVGGLVGATPDMMAASVMALARLVHEFGGALAGAAEQLLPAVLLLLRMRSREVIKAVLGFVKVARPPRPALQTEIIRILLVNCPIGTQYPILHAK